jgi:hypothetical protein
MLRMWGTNEDGTPWQLSVRCWPDMIDLYLLEYYWKYDKWEYTY